jgi:hypothetical protein
MKQVICTVWAVGLLAMFAPSTARASCVSIDKKVRSWPGRVLTPQTRAAFTESQNGGSESHGTSIVGLWTVTFLFGDGPDVFDRGFEQWHSDGTEFTMDVAVPPDAGNICVGVWEQVGPRTVKLHHVGWNWDTTQTPTALAGTFVLDMLVTAGSGGHTFTGKYVTDSYDVNGIVIPSLHVEGVVQGTRITVND